MLIPNNPEQFQRDMEEFLNVYDPEAVHYYLEKVHNVPSHIIEQKDENVVVTFVEILLEYKEDYVDGLSEDSKQTYNSTLNQFAGFVQERGFDINEDITKIMTVMNILDFLDKKTISLRTRNKKLSILRSLLSYAIENKRVDSRILNNSLLTQKKVKSMYTNHLSKEIAFEIINLALKNRYGLRDFTLFSTLFATGFRISEVLNLKIGDINYKSNLITVRRLKKREEFEEVLPMDESLSKFMRQYIEKTFADKKEILSKDRYNNLYLFSPWKRKGNEPLSRSEVNKLFHRLIRKSTLIPDCDKSGRYKLHSFRHLYGKLLLENNVPLPYIQALLGHENLSTTQIYLNVSNNELVKAIEKHPLNGDIHRLLSGIKI